MCAIPRTLCRLLLALALTPCLAAAQDDPLATLSAAQKNVVQKFIAKQRSDGTDAQPVQALLHDLDGDGQTEIVLSWGQYFGNSEAASVTAFKPAAAGKWREAGSVAVLGSPLSMTVQGPRVELTVQRMAPGDARCCPSLKAVQRLSYAQGRLADDSKTASPR